MKHVIYGDKTNELTPRLLNNLTIEVGALVDYGDSRGMPVPVFYSVMMSTMITIAQGDRHAAEILKLNLKEMDRALDDILKETL